MNYSMMLRRSCCFSTSSSSALNLSFSKKPLVFLGSPQVAVTVLDALLSASTSPDSLFEVAAIVTQPPSARDRGRKVMPSPVAQHALDSGFPSDLIFTPERAGEELFLSNLRALQPELCITAAYGNILSTKFLNIPPLGTINIHPSLLPLYRGAAPVQRALQDGVKETGVSLAFTLRALDAGPVIATERIKVDDQIKAPDLLALLFSRGSKLLIHELPSIFDGSARLKARPQDNSKATLAPKVSMTVIFKSKIRLLSLYLLHYGNSCWTIPTLLRLLLHHCSHPLLRFSSSYKENKSRDVAAGLIMPTFVSTESSISGTMLNSVTSSIAASFKTPPMSRRTS